MKNTSAPWPDSLTISVSADDEELATYTLVLEAAYFTPA
jgi:hypothetical protein